MRRFALPQAQPIAAQLEFKRVAQRSGTDSSDIDTRRDTHLQQSPANLIAGRTIMPELIQADASPEKIAATADLLLKSPARLHKMRADLTAVKTLLGSGGASSRVAEIALGMLSDLQPQNRVGKLAEKKASEVSC